MSRILIQTIIIFYLKLGRESLGTKLVGASLIPRLSARRAESLGTRLSWCFTPIVDVREHEGERERLHFRG